MHTAAASIAKMSYSSGRHLCSRDCLFLVPAAQGSYNDTQTRTLSNPHAEAPFVAVNYGKSLERDSFFSFFLSSCGWVKIKASLVYSSLTLPPNGIHMCQFNPTLPLLYPLAT